MLLPRAHRVTSRVEIKRAPAEIWAVVRDFAQVPGYWRSVKASVRQPDRDGHETWSQTMKDGFVIPLVIEEELPPSRLVTRIALDGKAPFGGSWIYEITAQPGGSRVTVTEDGFVNNPFFRVVSRIMGHHSTIDSYLRALAVNMGEPVSPEHVP
jgi:uncharacterized protein YndB with AHSA1/START domain